MKLYHLNFVLGVALAAVLTLLVLIRVDNSQPNYQVNLGDDMTYSPAYSSYETNSNFANGRTLQKPVSGTIARGSKIFRFDATPQDALRAGEQLVNPFDLTTEEGLAATKRGATVFQTFCITCHGADAAGSGPVAKRGFPPPPSLLTGKSREMKDGQLFHILTCGQNSMPQFAAQLPPDRRWEVINHIRRLQQETQPPATAIPPTPETSDQSAPSAAAETSQILESDPVAPVGTDTEPNP